VIIQAHHYYDMRISDGKINAALKIFENFSHCHVLGICHSYFTTIVLVYSSSYKTLYYLYYK